MAAFHHDASLSFFPSSFPSSSTITTAHTPFGPRQRREGITWRRDQPFFTYAPGHGVDVKKQDGHHEQKQEQEDGGDEDTHQHRREIRARGVAAV